MQTILHTWARWEISIRAGVQVSSLWDEQATLKLGGKVIAENIHVAASPSLAVAHYMERGSNFVDGKEQKVSLRTTTTFRKENGLWKVIGHHTDTLPYLK